MFKMKLKFFIIALFFNCVFVETSQCGKFSELKDEDKLIHAKIKYVTHAQEAFNKFDLKAEQNLIMSDDEINKIFSKPLKWCAKYLYAASTSEKDEIPEEFTIFIANTFNEARDKASFEQINEIDPNYVASMQRQFSQFQSEIWRIYQKGIRLGSEEIIEKCMSLQKENDNNIDLFYHAYQQQPYVFLEALEDVFKEILGKCEEKNTRNPSKKIFDVSYLYLSLEGLFPGCLSQHLPDKKKKD